MIAFRNFALRRGERLLLSNVDLALHDGWRIGVVGRNGCGKTSLFAALQGELEADAGAIDLPARTRIAAVAQETPALADTAIDYTLAGDADLFSALQAELRAAAAGDHAAAADAHHRIEELQGYDARARAGRLLHGLGFAASTHLNAVASFSGGWRVRLNLARALMAPSDLLLLDEPTNHLDLDAVLWLEEWLRRYAGMLLLISHDREFLDGVCSHVVHLHEGRARIYVGDYSSFERQRSEHLRQQQIAHAKEQVERAHLQAFIDRFKAKASKAKQAQSRMKRLAKLAGTEAVRAESPFRFDFPTAEHLPVPLLRLNAVDAGYAVDGASECEPSPQPLSRGERGFIRVLADVMFALEPGDRVALLGPNGAGKSTLVKTLVGELSLLAGERLIHPDARVGYFAQHTLESLRAGVSPIGHLQKLAPRASEKELRSFLGRWNFAGDRAFEVVDEFSGGERARLALALIAYTKPNLLLLDEPTNHLDMDMREALAEALAEFDGALVLVSHDRHLIGMVCDTFWRVAGGLVQRFDGDLDDYSDWLRRRDREAGGDLAAGDAPSPRTASAVAEPVTGKARRRQAAEQRERERPLRNRIRQVEVRLAKVEHDLLALANRLTEPNFYVQRAAETGVLLQQQGALRREKETLEDEWLTLHATLDAALA